MPNVLNNICMSSYCPRGSVLQYTAFTVHYQLRWDGFCMNCRPNRRACGGGGGWRQNSGIQLRDVPERVMQGWGEVCESDKVTNSFFYLLTKRWWRYIKTDQRWKKSGFYLITLLLLTRQHINMSNKNAKMSQTHAGILCTPTC